MLTSYLVLPPYRVTSRNATTETLIAVDSDELNAYERRSINTGASIEALPLKTYSRHHPETEDVDSIRAREDSVPEQHETESFREQTWHDGMSYDSVRGGGGSESPQQPATEPTDWLLPELQLPSRSFSVPKGGRLY